MSDDNTSSAEQRDAFVRRFRQDLAEQGEAAGEDSFETERLRFVLTRCNLTRYESVLRDRHERYSGQRLLRFERFHEVFPTFPITLAGSRLGGVRLHADQRCLVADLFRSFRPLPCVKAYEELYEERRDTLDEGQALGLVFPFKGLRQGLVIYLGERPSWALGLTAVYGVKPGQPRLVVQPFQTLIEAIHARGRGWTPEPRL